MYDELVKRLREPCQYENCVLCQQAADAIEELQGKAKILERIADKWCDAVPKWIPVAERLPSDFVSVQAHMTDAGNFPPVREAYVVDKLWFFPALKEFHPVDMWRQFDEPPKEE